MYVQPHDLNYFHVHQNCSRISRGGNNRVERKHNQVSRADEDSSELVLSAAFLASENLKGLVSGMSSQQWGSCQK